MCRTELDGRFYEIAMSFFIEAGHASHSEPEYVNYSSEYLFNKGDRRIGQFDNLSLLFVTHQCMFFSVEILPSGKNRQLIAQSIHKKIHSRIETVASICFFRYDNEVMLTFMGYGSKCILSNWYSLVDCNELAERLDIANISTNSDYDYFHDLVYNCEKDYCGLDEDELYYQPYSNNIPNIKLIEQEDEQIGDIPWETVYKEIMRYGKKYDKIISQPFLDTVGKWGIMFHAEKGKAYNPFGDEIQFDIDEDFFEEKVIESISDQNRKQNDIIPKQESFALFPASATGIDPIWPDYSITRQTIHNEREKIYTRYVQSYISNIAFPKTLDELDKIYIKKAGDYDLEEVLSGYPETWTAPKWAKKDDIVFFMHACTARATISALSSELKRKRHLYDEDEVDLLKEWLLLGKELYDRYGGKIFAVGRVASEPYYIDDDDDDEDDVAVHWNSRVYADIKDCWVLEKPVDISMFRSFISISRFSSITRIHSEEYEKLKKIILDTNPNPPDFFVHSIM